MEFNVEKTIAKIDASRVKMALPFRAYGDIRQALNAITVRPAADGGVLVMATDGHIAGVITDIGGRTEGELLLPIGKEQKSYLGKADWVFVDDKRFVWIVDDAFIPLWVSPTPCVDAKFPDIRLALDDVSKYKPGLFGAFSPKLISRIKEVYGNQGKFKASRFFTHEEKEGLAMFTLGEDGFGLLMGMRDPAAGRHELAAIDVAVPSEFRVAA